MGLLQIREVRDMTTNLQKMRKKRGYSQSQLADKSNVKLPMIQKYEQGVKNINKASVETVLKLANALHCDITDIME